MKSLLALFLISSSAIAQPVPGTVPYTIVAIRGPRGGAIQQVFDPIDHSPGQDLVLIHPDGSEDTLVAAGNGACFDPVMSLDGKRVYFAKVADQTAVNGQVRNGNHASVTGSDIYVLDLATREVKQLTRQEITPNTGAYDWNYKEFMNLGAAWRGETGSRTGYGVYNMGPCPVPDGKGGERLVFTSNRNCFLPPKGFSFPNMQLFVMDADGKNVEQIGLLNIGSALHPVLMQSGEVMFSSWESQGLRDQRLWSLWSIWPDGRVWEPLYSAFTGEHAVHWQTQLPDGRIVADAYYNLTNLGFGTLLAFRKQDDPAKPPFGSPNPLDGSNPAVSMPGYNASLNPSAIAANRRFSFSPPGLECLTQFANMDDTSAALLDGVIQGKVGQPMTAPGGDVLLVYSPGRANFQQRPVGERPWCQIALLKGGQPITRASGLTLLKADERYEYQQPHAVVSWKDIYGSEPKFLPINKNDGSKHPLLPAGTPYGLVGTSSVYKRNSAPHKEAFQSSNWGKQGADAGLYDNSEIDAIRIIQTEPRSYAKYPIGKTPPAWKNQINERLKILGEVKLRKFDAAGKPILDPEGNPDTSFLARIPADVPWTMQLIDTHGAVLAGGQTWKQLRPGEIRNNCGGCHAHAQVGLDFGLTAAAKPEYQVPTLDKVRVVEFIRDVKPILDANCASCHTTGHPTGLVLDGTPDATYAALTATKYVTPLQARRSLLYWKVRGQRTDEFDKRTDPVQNPNLQPPMSGVQMPYQLPALPDAAMRTIAEWIDTGCAFDAGAYYDDLRPTVEARISGSKLLIGAIDSDALLADKPSAKVNGIETSLVSAGEGLWSGDLPAGISGSALVTASAIDNAGHRTTLTRSLEITSAPNQPPVANNDIANTPFQTPVEIDILANDADPDGTLDSSSLVYSVQVGGAVSTVNGLARFVPAQGFSGTASFMYTVKDNFGVVSNTASCTITVGADCTAEIAALQAKINQAITDLNALKAQLEQIINSLQQ